MISVALFPSLLSCFRHSAIIVITTVLLSIISVLTLSNSILQPSFSEIIAFGNNGTAISTCNCVVFRMDGIQDYWISAGQLAAMNQFMVRNQSLTLGILTNDTGEDTDIVDNVRRGVNSGLFELAIHGANDTDHTIMSEEQQRNSLNESNAKIIALFRNASDIFVPPFDAFNAETMNAMRQVDMTILSANTSSFNELQLGGGSVNGYVSPLSDPTQSRTVFYVPSTISFKDYFDDQYLRNSVEDIFNNVTQSIGAYGYAVVVMNPTDFMIPDPVGDPTETLNVNEITDLSRLIDMMLTNNVPIGSFSEITAGMQSGGNTSMPSSNSTSQTL
jgi:Polysaccharide deacetylase